MNQPVLGNCRRKHNQDVEEKNHWGQAENKNPSSNKIATSRAEPSDTKLIKKIVGLLVYGNSESKKSFYRQKNSNV